MNMIFFLITQPSILVRHYCSFRFSYILADAVLRDIKRIASRYMSGYQSQQVKPYAKRCPSFGVAALDEHFQEVSCKGGNNKCN